MLGDLFKPRPPINPNQPASDQPLQPTGDTQGKLRELFENPRTRAFMLNLSANLMMGNSLGVSAGRGLQGIGRFEERHGELTQQQADRDRAILESDRNFNLKKEALNKRGGGGGGGSGTTKAATSSSLPDNITQKQYNARFMKNLDDARDNSTGELTETQLRGMAHIATLADFGDTTPLQISSEADPSLKNQLLEDFAGGPEGGYTQLRAMQELGQSGPSPSLINDTQSSPEQPAQPVGSVNAAPVAMPGVDGPAGTIEQPGGFGTPIQAPQPFIPGAGAKASSLPNATPHDLNQRTIDPLTLGKLFNNVF